LIEFHDVSEVMPAKPGKDFVTHQLTKALQTLHKTLPPMLLKNTSSDTKEVSPPPTKRQKVTSTSQERTQ
jgi:predicted nucleotidyltransferase